MFSRARYLQYCVVVLLIFIVFSNSVKADWSWPSIFSSDDTGAQPRNQPLDRNGTSGKPVLPPASKSLPNPQKDSSSQPLSLTPTMLPLSSSGPGPAPGQVPPSSQKAPATSRTLFQFSQASKLDARILEEDTRWSGTLQIDGMVTVSPQTTLTIMPGTKIRFAANSGILVYGRIILKGTPESPVFISSLYETPRPADWHGIYLVGTEKNNIFDHLIIQGADTAIQAAFSAFTASGVRIENSSTALRLLNSTVTIKNSALSAATTAMQSVKSEIALEAVTIEKNGSGLYLLSSSLTAVNVILRYNTGTALVADKSQLRLDRLHFASNKNGLKLTGCDGSITASRFIANKDTAVALSASNFKFSDNHISGSRVGLQLDDNNTAVWRNSISGNSSYNLLYLGDEQCFVGGNWLGENISRNDQLSLFSKRPGALLTAPLLPVDPYPAVKPDSIKAID